MPLPTRRTALLAVVASLVVVVAIVLVQLAGDADDPDTSPVPSDRAVGPEPSTTPPGGTATGPTLEPSPGTDTEGPSTTDRDSPEPGAVVATEAPTLPQPVGRTTVTTTVALYDAASSSVQVSGYADVVETDGSCTLTLSSTGRTVEVTGPALSDASSTSCGTLSVPRVQMAPGTWTAVLSYRSTEVSGEAAPVSIEVP